jgi:uncharacterized protein (TIGR03118 family)
MKEGGMKVMRLLPVGLLVTGALSVGFGCGEEGTSATSVESALSAPAASSVESKVRQKNLASNATVPDPPLANAWGLAFDPATPGIWISVNGSGSAQLFTEDGHREKAVALGVDDPTGVVFNGSKDFDGDDLIFASESGIIVGMQGGGSIVSSRFTTQDPEPAVYKGIALARVHGKRFLFATDFHNGKIDVIDGDYNLCTSCAIADDTIPAGFAPFNALAVGDHLIVTYAMQDGDRHDDVRGPGNGFVDVFDLEDGTFERLLSGPVDHPELSSPWALALSAEPHERGSVDLLVGDFGGPNDGFTPNLDGLINVYDLSRSGKHLKARLEGHLADRTGAPLNIDGLWGFIFGNGKAGFGRDDLYFAAGPNDESDGLFGELDFIGRRR